MVKGGTGMASCHNQKENLVLYVYGELDSNSGKEIEDHLAKCKSCRHEHQQLLSLLGNIKEVVSSPELSPKQVNSLVANIKWQLNDRRKEKWWRRYLDFRPARMITAIAAACILIIVAGIIGYVKNTDTNEFQPVAGQQNKGVMLSDTDLEIIKNLEFLKEMDAIQKLSQVVDFNEDKNPQGELDNETRGMRQDGYRRYFV
jgi:DNA gyrase/topoisomerase IV subunit A